jgi:light-regulated signal transduction histidine kinase (bacteriophytochrome)
MGAMTASIAHEVSQPLAAIIANANAALRWLERSEPEVDEIRAALRRIVKEGHRTSEVITSIRGMFGKSDTERSLVDVNALIREVLSLVRGEIQSHDAVVQCETADGALYVIAERVQLQQVLINLVTNAIDAMSDVIDREKLLKVSSGLCDCDEIQICVEDSGMGIDEANMPHLFEAFFTTKPHGMGMGLSICRSIPRWPSLGRAGPSLRCGLLHSVADLPDRRLAAIVKTFGSNARSLSSDRPAMTLRRHCREGPARLAWLIGLQMLYDCQSQNHKPKHPEGQGHD